MIFFNLSIYTNETSTITVNKRHKVYHGKLSWGRKPNQLLQYRFINKYNGNTMPRTIDLSHREIALRTVQTSETLKHETLAKLGCLLLPYADPEPK